MTAAPTYFCSLHIARGRGSWHLRVHSLRCPGLARALQGGGSWTCASVLHPYTHNHAPRGNDSAVHGPAAIRAAPTAAGIKSVCDASMRHHACCTLECWREGLGEAGSAPLACVQLSCSGTHGETGGQRGRPGLGPGAGLLHLFAPALHSGVEFGGLLVPSWVPRSVASEVCS
jgi:hypothetical protein